MKMQYVAAWVCLGLTVGSAWPAAGQRFGVVDPESQCRSAVQGKIAWSYTHQKDWDKNNLEALCRLTTQPREPGRCFQQVMHGGVDWGGGTTWLWQNALKLCASTNDADATIKCFSRRIGSGDDWSVAIDQCRRKVPAPRSTFSTRRVSPPPRDPPSGKPPSPLPPPSKPKPILTDLDLRMAWLTQQLSAKAYHDSPDLSDVPDRQHWVREGSVPKADRVERVEMIHRRVFLADTQVLVARNDSGMIFVAFRGTQEGADPNTSTHSKRVKHKKSCKFHAGYLKAVRSVESRLDKVLKDQIERLQRRCVGRPPAYGQPCGRVIFTGHSLGGSLATIAYQLFAEKQEQGKFPSVRQIGRELYTFGAPRAITFMCQRQIWTDLDLRANAVLNDNDRLSGAVARGGRHENRYLYPDKVYLFRKDGTLRVVSGDSHNPNRGASGGHKLKHYRTSLNREFKRAGWSVD